jgi:hypothetical protein
LLIAHCSFVRKDGLVGRLASFPGAGLLRQ